MKTILFDLDGTLVNSEEGITKCAAYALSSFGITVPNQEQLHVFIGPPLVQTFRNEFGMKEEDAREAVLRYRERYHPIGIFECQLYDGVEEVLRNLKRKGYQIGMASSKPEVSCRKILEHFRIDSYFDDVVGATLDGKIDTKIEVLREAIRRMHLTDLKDVVLIGDTRFDVLGAKEAGIDCIGVSFGFGTREELLKSGALCVCDTLREVAEYIEQYESV